MFPNFSEFWDFFSLVFLPFHLGLYLFRSWTGSREPIKIWKRMETFVNAFMRATGILRQFLCFWGVLSGYRTWFFSFASQMKIRMSQILTDLSIPHSEKGQPGGWASSVTAPAHDLWEGCGSGQSYPCPCWAPNTFLLNPLLPSQHLLLFSEERRFLNNLKKYLWWKYDLLYSDTAVHRWSSRILFKF